jgi:hypothetical protein
VPCLRSGMVARVPGMPWSADDATRGRWLLAVTLGWLLCLGTAAVAEAHVNRQVGPYTILVILVEEPTFDDNHAGFQFWVRRDQQPIVGLERSVHAEASGHGQHVALRIPPIGGGGFYVLDRTGDGAAFDPLGGGAWSLHLWGDIEGTPLDEDLPVTFPSYPRIGAPNAVAQRAATPSPAAPPNAWLVLLLPASLGGVLAAIGISRRIRLRPVPPTLEQPR